MAITIRYLMTCCRARWGSECEVCPIKQRVLKESDGWDMRLDRRGGTVTCQRGDGPVIHLPPGCYACAWEEEPV